MNMYKAISDDLGIHCCKGLRKGLINKELQYKYIIRNVIKSMKTNLSENGFTNKEIKTFIRKDSFLFRHKTILAWRSMDWLKERGLESLPEYKATNDLMDLDYIVIATYGKGILSNEEWVKLAYEEMQAIINLHINGG
ncbi:MAG: hypothetical protein QY317_03110 [Candidatus Jettenia caeni]|nr:MAG: hypothetical protein QY317_03110 [Candidatus Jettenia caeni]